MKRSRIRRSPQGARNLGDFEAIYRDSYKAISRYVTLRVPSASHDDVVAAVYTVAWKKFSSKPEAPLPWLYRIASYEVSHERRRLQREQKMVALPLEDLLAVTSNVAAGGLANALAQLSDDDQELLRLVYWDEADRSSIAVVLGCSVNTLNVRVHRALERLRGAISLSAVVATSATFHEIHGKDES